MQLAYIICASHTNFGPIVSGRCGTRRMRSQIRGKKHDHSVITHHVVNGKSFFPPPLSYLAILGPHAKYEEILSGRTRDRLPSPHVHYDVFLPN